ncbi:MAG TPA: hypothetical protein VGJ15_10840 [Pirellulales bacterium]|jgi:hypothetical protein
MPLFSATHSIAAETDDFSAGAGTAIVASTTAVGETSTRATEPAVIAKMPRQPAPSVADLSARLYRAYAVDGGQVRLAGCTLEPQPILHIEISGNPSDNAAISNGHGDADRAAATTVELKSSQPVHIEHQISAELFLTADGKRLDNATIESLGLRDLIRLEKPPRLTVEELDCLLAVARSAAPRGKIEIVWCRYAAGKLRFTIDEQSAEQSFADWAALVAPPPFVCPHSGKSSFHLAALDDGRIVAAEEIAPCEISGRKLLRGELATCSVTGKRVAPDLIEACSVTQQPVLREKMTQCPTCLSEVSPQAISSNRCPACREPPTMIKTDSRIAGVFTAHPGLNRWHHWKMSITPKTLLLEATSIWRELQLVLDKTSFEPLRLATKNRLQRTWSDLPRDQWQAQLK